ncbi:Hsp70-like protein, partial [Globisporangium splendens]
MVQLLLLSVGALALCASLVDAIVAGVDFGGEFFKIALVKPGTPFEIVTNVHSKRKTETMVAFDGDERLYGADAATVAVRRPQTAYSQIRRFLGATPNSPEVVSLLQEEYFPYTLLKNETRGTISLEHDNKQVFHAEELVAMVFSHARQITDAFAEAPVKDWVITVPTFFSQAQRQAMLDAAEISGVRVLSLINENTAAALQHAVHSTFTEPRRILFYNMGSTSLQVSIAEFNSEVIPDGFKKNKTVSAFQMIANAWDETLGGAKFDLQLAEHLALEFNKKLGGDEDVRTLPRPLAKIRAQAKKTKIVLSANEEIPVVMQSLYKDMDFFTTMTRSKFEEINADLFARALTPVQRALDKVGLTVNDIDEIEIIGGGVRMPKIQQQLKEFFNGKDLGVHLNGDEAMALGSAFRAANLSNSFRVRHVGMTDIGSYPVGVRLVDLEHSNMAEHKSTDGESDEESSKHWVKRASLFTESSRLGLRKAVSFLHSEDVSCTFRYDKPSGLPAGVNAHIGKFNITGIKAFADSMKDKKLGEPKVTLSFELDSNGIAKIAKAEATLEEEYEVEVEVTKPKKSKKADKKKEGGDDAEKKDDASADEEKEDDEPAVKETKKEIKKKIHRAALTVVLGHETHDTGMSVLPMSVAAKKDSIRILRDMEQADNQRKANLEAKNRLETYVYNARDTLNAKAEAIEQVTQPEQLEQLQTKLEETEEWLYDDGEKVEAAEYNKKVKNLDKDLSAILFRVAELKEFPIAVNTAEEYAFSTRELMNEWIESKPQVSEEERKDVLEKVEELEAWLVSATKKQKDAKAYEPPVVTSAEVNKQVQGVKKLVATLSKKPKPAPVKTDDDKKGEDSNSTSSTDGETESDEKKEAGSSSSGEGDEKKEDAEEAASNEAEVAEHEEL